MSNKSKIILRDYIRAIPTDINKNEVSLKVTEKIYDDVKHLLKNGCFKGIKLYC
jgi:ribosomal protein S13